MYRPYMIQALKQVLVSIRCDMPFTILLYVNPISASRHQLAKSIEKIESAHNIPQPISCYTIVCPYRGMTRYRGQRIFWKLFY